MKPLAQGIAVAAVALSFAVLSGVVQPARAACNDDLLEMQAQAEQITDEANKMEVKAHLEAATKAASVQDEVTCNDQVRMAREKMKK